MTARMPSAKPHIQSDTGAAGPPVAQASAVDVHWDEEIRSLCEDFSSLNMYERCQPCERQQWYGRHQWHQRRSEEVRYKVCPLFSPAPRGLSGRTSCAGLIGRSERGRDPLPLYRHPDRTAAVIRAVVAIRSPKITECPGSLVDEFPRPVRAGAAISIGLPRGPTPSYITSRRSTSSSPSYRAPPGRSVPSIQRSLPALRPCARYPCTWLAPPRSRSFAEDNRLPEISPKKKKVRPAGRR